MVIPGCVRKRRMFNENDILVLPFLCSIVHALHTLYIHYIRVGIAVGGGGYEGDASK